MTPGAQVAAMCRVIAAASTACSADQGDMVTVLIAALASTAGNMPAGADILAIAIDSLELARQAVISKQLGSTLVNAPGGVA